MIRTQAIALIQRLVRAEVEVMKRCNSASGRITKKVLAEERAAAANIFRELTGDDPGTEEVADMVSL